jgi:hypothetical protein
MKRLVIVTANIGLVLIALCSAFYLVSLIPQGDLGKKETGRRTLLPETFQILYIAYSRPLNPQTGVRIVLKTNGTLNIILFNTHYNDTVKWLSQHSPTPNWNTTLLAEFVASNSSHLTLEQTVTSGGNFTFEYVPPKVENATVIVSNPTSAAVYLVYENKTIIVVASPERIFLALMIGVPLGVALTVPWMAYSLKEKQKIKKTATSASV